jgi:hypothetical protein
MTLAIVYLGGHMESNLLHIPPGPFFTTRELRYQNKHIFSWLSDKISTSESKIKEKQQAAIKDIADSTQKQ